MSSKKDNIIYVMFNLALAALFIVAVSLLIYPLWATV